MSCKPSILRRPAQDIRLEKAGVSELTDLLAINGLIHILRPQHRTPLSIGYPLRISHSQNSTLQSTMFHIIFSVTSGFLYLRNVLQGFARGLLALRSLDTISSYLTPAISPPPPVPLLGAPVPFVERSEPIILSYPSRDVIATQRQFPVSASPFPIYQSSLIAVTPDHFPKFLPVLVILAVISGFVVILPEISYFFINIVKSFKSKPMFYYPSALPPQFASSKLPISLVSLLLLWTGPVLIHSSFA
jgi:hypothetical protein